MIFQNTVGVPYRVSAAFWKCIDDSHTIEKMYDEHENVLVTLKDSFSTVRFIYYKGRENESIRILNEDDRYVGQLWRNDNDETGSVAEGDKGKRKVVQILKMFEKSLATGRIELEVEKNDMPPSLYVPLSPREQLIVDLLKKGLPYSHIKEKLELTPLKKKKIRKSLIRKGVIKQSLEELYS
ncbi:hypothetical protein [Evansella clarkii]|uniref:hypothetical protein n=1 Tax=Evansella clarkii TaxID=79879 RepID=UPI0009967887|nr:hypothetical protein [Evansella clarkii]